MKHINYKTKNVCATTVSFDLDDNNLVHNLVFENGCPGNLLAISKICENKPAEELINYFEGNKCGSKKTSCVDQFALALKENC